MLRNGDAASLLPRANINCTASLRSAAEDGTARQTEGDRNFEIDTGHDLMITEPNWVAQTLIQIAEIPAERR